MQRTWGRASSRGQIGTAHPSREEPGKGAWLVLIGRARFPGEATSRGRTVLLRRVAAGAELARGDRDAWQKLPVSSTAPDQAFNEACGRCCKYICSLSDISLPTAKPSLER